MTNLRALLNDYNLPRNSARRDRARSRLPVALVNVAPLLLDVVDAARDIGLHAHQPHELLDNDGWPSGDSECIECSEDWPCPTSTLRDALAALDKATEQPA